MERFSNINTLLAFVTVAREGSVSRAAKVLNLTQPAVSHQIKRLSSETGITLFTRTPTGLRITPAGAALFPKAESVLASMSEFHRSARQSAGQIRGTLKIGTIVDPDFLRLGQFLAALVDSYPELQTEFSHGMSGQVITRLLGNEIDVGYFLGELDLPEIQDQPDLIHRMELTKITYRIVAPTGWDRLIDGRDMAALAELPWIGTPPDSVHSRVLDRLFAAHGCAQNTVAQVDQEPVMLAMVKSGVGLSLCQEATALEQRQTRGLTVVDGIQIQTPLSFVALHARLEDPNINASFNVLKTVWEG